MARSGRHVEDVIESRGLGSDVVVGRLLETVGHDYRPVEVGARRYRFSRAFRPTWSLVVGLVLLPVVIGLPLLLHRRTETWDAAVEEDHTGVRVQVSGTVLPSTLLRLRDALRGARPARPGPVTPTPTPDPVDGLTPLDPSAGSGGPLPSGSPAPSQAVPRPPAAVGSVPSAAEESVAPAPVVSVPVGAEPVDGDRTVLVRDLPGRAGPPAGLLVLSFDTGERRPLHGRLLVGRDPSASEGDGDAELVRVTDPDYSVSKTHLALTPDGAGGVVVVDRGSTNGTAVEDERGNLSPVVAGAPVTARAGQTVRFGMRAILISEERV